MLHQRRWWLAEWNGVQEEKVTNDCLIAMCQMWINGLRKKVAKEREREKRLDDKSG
jgi:hypothetical protein